VSTLAAINANMGTITAGTLSAGTIFAGALSAATGTFAGSLSAATGSFTGSLTVGSSPAVSGTTMTGSGAKINSSGTFALGDDTTNITYNGSSLYLNGDVVSTSNINLNAVTVPVVATGAVGTAFSTGVSVNIRTAATSFPEDTTITVLFTALKTAFGAGDIYVILNCLTSANVLVATFAGGTTGELVQTMGPNGDKVTAIFTGSYVIPSTGSYKIEAIVSNPYGGSWTADYCTIIVLEYLLKLVCMFAIDHKVLYQDDLVL